MRRLLPLIIVFGFAVGWRLPREGAPAPIVPPPPPPLAPGQTPPLQTVLQRSANGHFYVDAEVNGEMVHFLVDTGATTVALTEEDAARAGIAFSPQQFTTVGQGASGPISGEVVSVGRIKIDQKDEYDVPGVVLDHGLGVSLLGQSFLSRIHSVAINGDQMTLG